MNYAFIKYLDDKIIYKSAVLLVITLFLSNVAILISPDPASSKELNWSFEDHPYPHENQRTSAEKAALADVPDYNHYTKYCLRYIEAQFKIYNARYPSFEHSGTPAQRLAAWKLHVVVAGQSNDHRCILKLPFLKLIYIDNVEETMFCGVFSGAPVNWQEHAFVETIKEMIVYADLGILSVIYDFIAISDPNRNISLNPDVEYFFRKSLQTNDEYLDYWNTDHLVRSISPERRAFVDAAVERGDLMAVLNSTLPCSEEGTSQRL